MSFAMSFHSSFWPQWLQYSPPWSIAAHLGHEYALVPSDLVNETMGFDGSFSSILRTQPKNDLVSGTLIDPLSICAIAHSHSAIIFSFSPIFRVLLALIIYGDPINIEFVISTILMISAILLINKDFNKEEVKNEKRNT